MDNKTALFLAILIAGFFLLDHFYLGWGAGFFLSQKFAGLIQKIAFWQ